MKPRGRIALWPVLLLALGSACDKEPVRLTERGETTSAPAPRSATCSPLRTWLERVPADARWALVGADLDDLRALFGDVWTLWQKHPDLQPFGLTLRKKLVRRWGGWPLDPKVWARLRRPPGSGGLVYRRADGVTVLAFRTTDLPGVLRKTTEAVRHQGARAIEPLRSARVGGSRIWTMDGTWSCGRRGKAALCADVPAARWAHVTGSPKRSLWNGPLRRVPLPHLKAPFGAWLSLSARPGRRLASPAQRLTGWRPRGLWAHLKPGHRVRFGAFVLRRTDRSPAAAAPDLPPPGRSGLSAGQEAQLALRLRLAPAALVAQLERLLPGARPLTELLGHRQAAGEPLAAEILNGEVVLLSHPGGMAAVFGLRSRSRALRGMEKLSLLINARLGKWQKQVRASGKGRDLTFTRSNVGELPGHKLSLTLPRGSENPLPLVRDGRLELLWGVARSHLVVATDANLFRRIAARVAQSDRAFLDTLPGAEGRAAFSRHHAAALLLRPDDPLCAQPRAQRAVLTALLGRQPPERRPWVALARMLLDLTADLAVACDDHRAGLGCTAVWEPVNRAGRRLQITPRYLAALRRKWGGNRNGYLTALQQLAADEADSAARRKARRLLARRKTVLSRGLMGLTASVLVPWWQHRSRAAATRTAERTLERLAQAIDRLAQKAGSPSAPRARRRWHKALRSTPLTPNRPCCTAARRTCRSTAADWAHPTWQRIGFRPESTQPYRYQLLVDRRPTRIRLTLRALGDLNCNGRVGVLERVGTVDAATGALRFGRTTRTRADD